MMMKLHQETQDVHVRLWLGQRRRRWTNNKATLGELMLFQHDHLVN